MPPTDREFTGHDGPLPFSVSNSVRPTTRSAQTMVAVGAASAICAAGTVLTLTHLASPVRAPFTLFYLFVAPTLAVALLLPDADPLGRAVLATAAGVTLDLVLAAGMLALHMWSVGGGLVAVTVVSAALCLLPPLRRVIRGGGATAERGTGEPCSEHVNHVQV
jgi:hypothetical protein